MTKNNDKEEPLACPFCLHNAVLELSEQDEAYVICTSCMCQTNLWPHWEDAISTWNTRHGVLRGAK